MAIGCVPLRSVALQGSKTAFKARFKRTSLPQKRPLLKSVAFRCIPLRSIAQSVETAAGSVQTLVRDEKTLVWKFEIKALQAALRPCPLMSQKHQAASQTVRPKKTAPEETSGLCAKTIIGCF